MEAAIIIPAMVVFVLLIFQLTLLQHARIMTEYAAYCAARAGIVHNGDKNRMTNAAIVALLPTFSRTDDFGNFLLTWGKMKIITESTQFADQGVASITSWLTGIVGAGQNIPSQLANLSMVDVQMLEPRWSEIKSWSWKWPPWDSGFVGDNEVDFDRDSDGQHTITIELVYYYRLIVPFANQMLHLGWMASRLGAQMTGLLWTNPELKYQSGPAAQNLASRVPFAVITGGVNRDLLNMGVSWALTNAGQYVIPIRTTHTMHMQSNYFVDNLPK